MYFIGITHDLAASSDRIGYCGADINELILSQPVSKVRTEDTHVVAQISNHSKNSVLDRFDQILMSIRLSERTMNSYEHLLFLHILVSLLIRFGSTQCAISLQTTRVFGGNLLIFYEVKIAKQSDFGSILKHFLRNLALEKSLWSPKIDIELDLFVQKWKSSEKKVGMVCQCDGDLFGHVSAYFDCCVVEHA